MCQFKTRFPPNTWQYIRTSSISLFSPPRSLPPPPFFTISLSLSRFLPIPTPLFFPSPFVGVLPVRAFLSFLRVKTLFSFRFLVYELQFPFLVFKFFPFGFSLASIHISRPLGFPLLFLPKTISCLLVLSPRKSDGRFFVFGRIWKRRHDVFVWRCGGRRTEGVLWCEFCLFFCLQLS